MSTYVLEGGPLDGKKLDLRDDQREVRLAHPEVPGQTCLYLLLNPMMPGDQPRVMYEED